jgi:ADP-heptose:LPS heptosyltransferase
MVPTKRVLIYRIGSLGDTVAALPCFHLAARVFPDSERRLLTNFPIAEKAPPAAAILEHTGTVDGYFRYTIAIRGALAVLKIWWQIVRWRPQVLVYLAPPRGVAAARRDARFFRLCGIGRQYGVPLTEDMQRNRLLPDAGPFPDAWRYGCDLYENEACRLARNLVELGDARLDDPASWDLRLTPLELAKAAEVIEPTAGRPLIAVSIGTKVPANDWGSANWRALLTRLAEAYPTHALVMTGAAVDRAPSDLVAQGWRELARPGGVGPVLNLCGQLAPRESSAVYQRASVYLGHDSGPMHLAAAVQTPCVAIFSARQPAGVWFPFGAGHRVLYRPVDCRGCGLETCIVERKKCILSISVDEAMDEVREVLG